MPLTDVREIGALGLITDRPPSELPPHAWSRVSNFGFRGATAKVVAGAQQVLGTPSVDPVFIASAESISDLYWMYTDGVDVYVALDTTQYDISTAVADFTGSIDDKWDFQWLNGVMFLNNGVEAPHYWAQIDHTVDLAALPNWPSGYSCKTMRKFKNFLIAMDITKTSTRYPTLVLWSHPVDPGGYPESWDVADADYLAGEQPLSSTPGFLLDGLQLGDQFVIYKSDSIVLMQFVSGQSVFRFIDVPGGVGILAKGCVAQVYSGIHAFISSEGLPYLFNGQTLQPIAEARMEEDFQNDATQAYRQRSFVIYDPQERQIWFGLPEENEYVVKVYVYDMRYNTWHIRDIEETVSGAIGIFSPGGEELTWDTDTGTWASDTTTWGTGRDGSAVQRNLVFGHPNLTKILQWNVTDAVDGVSFTAELERTGLSIYGQTSDGQARVDFARVKLVTEVWPLVNVTDGATIDVYVGGQDNLEEAVSWESPVTFNPATQEKIDVLLQTKYVALKFVAASESQAEIHGYKLLVEDVGRYF